MPSQERFELSQLALAKALEMPSTFAGLKASAVAKGEPKKRGRAFLQSLLLPGWGQHYAGSNRMRNAFIISEALLWGSYLGFTAWGNWLEKDYRTFASTHANTSLDGKPSDYALDIGRFLNIYEYNQSQLRDRDVSDLYPETDEYYWQWDSEANRQTYDNLRVRRDLAVNRKGFALAAIFVNHLVSAIHSMLVVYKFNKKLEEAKVGLNIDVNQVKYSAAGPNVRVVVSKSF